ncbi:MAG: TetR/AcrR family transcriptional regulator [Erysipelothrix sp.]
MTISTKERVWNETLKMLLDGDDFDELNVQDICDKSNIHRSTFYRIFDDKYSLFEYGIDTLWQDYFSSHSPEMIIKPFTFANQFFSHSIAKDLIISQQKHTYFLTTLKKYTLSSFEASLKHFINDDRDFIAAYLVNTIDFIDTWNDASIQKLSIDGCDKRYLEIVYTILNEYCHDVTSLYL